MSAKMNRKSYFLLLVTLVIVAALGVGSLLSTTPAAASSSYEAESGANTLAGTAAVTSCSVCSGGSKVGNVGLGAGNTLQFNNVNVATAGSYTITIAYLNGDAGARTASMSVNGGGGTNVSFPQNGTWPNPNLATINVNVSLNAGNNTLKFSNASAYAPDFDKLTVNDSPTSYEAESAANTLAGTAVVSDYAPCSGGKRVSSVGLGAGNTLQFNNVNVATAGSYTITIAYLNGDAGARTASMSVNGGGGTNVSFPQNGTWPNPNVATINVNVSFNAGNNTLKFSNASAYAPDFDRIVVGGGGPTPTRTNTPAGPTPTRTNTPAAPTPTRTSTPPSGFPTSRDKYTWPYAASSIWNMPIHNNAQYVYAGINGMPGAQGMTIDEDIIIVSPGSPQKQIRENNAGWDGGRTRCGSLTSNYLYGGAWFPVPNNFHTDPGYDGLTPNMSGAILGSDGSTIYQTQPLHVCSDGGIVTSQYTFQSYNIKTGDGILGAHGGSGMSSFGGTIRMNELVSGSVIRHALKMNFYAGRWFSYNSGGYRWPAPRADSYASWDTYKGTVPQMRVGSLLALQPSFNVGSLRTQPGRIVAQAAKDYGIYAVDDTAWDVYALMIEWGPAGRVNSQFQSTWGYSISQSMLPSCGSGAACDWVKDMYDIVSNLYVIDNNSSSNIGGGPNSDTTNRRAPQAPPFSN